MKTIASLLFAWSLLLMRQSTALYIPVQVCPGEQDISPCTCEVGFGRLAVDCRNVTVGQIEEIFPQFRGKMMAEVVFYDVEDGRLPSRLFADMHVQKIYVVDSDLEGVSDSDTETAFLGLENSLRKLFIINSIKGHNQLRKLDLSHLQRLEHLLLKQNNITDLDDDWFGKGHTRLHALQIMNCSVTNLGDRAFEKLTNLKYFQVEDNPFKTFKRSMISKPARILHLLSLERSKLTTLPEDAFSNMSALSVVSLDGNAITRLESTTWRPIWDRLDSLTLRDNPLECDCHIEWMFQEIRRPTFLVGICSAPKQKVNMTLLRLIWDNPTKLTDTTETGGLELMTHGLQGENVTDRAMLSSEELL